MTDNQGAAAGPPRSTGPVAPFPGSGAFSCFRAQQFTKLHEWVTPLETNV